MVRCREGLARRSNLEPTLHDGPQRAGTAQVVQQMQVDGDQIHTLRQGVDHM